MTVRAPALRVPVDDLAPGDRALPADAAAYVARVHRLGPGDGLVLFDPERALEADASIVDCGKRAVVVHVGDPRPAARPSRSITLIQGIGKGDKMDAIARDATELGATAIVPALCARSVARPDASRAARWKRIAIEAARQCGRGDIPAIAPPTDFGEALQRLDGPALRLVMDPRGAGSIGAALAAIAPADAIVFAVGPEGGFSEEEMAAADEAGFQRVIMGSLVLRTETVCAAVLGAILAMTR